MSTGPGYEQVVRVHCTTSFGHCVTFHGHVLIEPLSDIIMSKNSSIGMTHFNYDFAWPFKFLCVKLVAICRA